MKPTPSCLTQLVGFVTALVCASSFAGEPLKLAIVACYDPDKAESAGARAHAILQGNHIFSIAAGSRGYSLSVPVAQEAKARRILAQAVKSEGLELTLLRLDHGFYEAVTADSVLRSSSK